MKKNPSKAILISHTHWDRAWYLPFQTYRLALVRLIDQVLDLLDHTAEFNNFMLDGQMLPICDYLDIRPEKQETLQHFVNHGKLTIGPWYCLADEYLVSPESLIRNLMYGIRLGDHHGGAAKVGYVPDSFGHISQLPQILKGFGIDSALFWRGMGDEAEQLGDEFIWSAPNGSKVLAIHLRKGYFNVSNLGYPNRFGVPDPNDFDIDLAVARLQETAEDLLTSNHSGVVLLMNGFDHAPPEPKIPQMITKANASQDQIVFKHGTISAFLKEVRQGLPGKLETYQGEFNRSRFAFGLQGVYSSRMYLQQANHQAQLNLEKYAEPLSTWSWISGTPYPEHFLELAWKTLLKNHPHDDICGCSSDPVHQENMVRFQHLQQITDPIIEASLHALSTHIELESTQGVNFLLYNPLPLARSETAVLDLFVKEEYTLPDVFHLVDPEGTPLEMQIVASSRVYLHRVNQSHPYMHYRIAVFLADYPGCGYSVLTALPGAADRSPAPSPGVTILKNGMENKFLRVHIHSNGTLDLFHKPTGRHYTGLLEFVDQDDVGDEYDFAPSPYSETISSIDTPAMIKKIHEGPLLVSYQINRDFTLPESIQADRQRRSDTLKECHLSSLITLKKDSPYLEVKTRFHNHVQDHRLRVHFPTGFKTDRVYSDGHFCVNQRTIDRPEGQHWDQPPAPTSHQRSFVDLSNGDSGLAIFNQGLPEYEIIPDPSGNTIALTLLRCVGFLSHGDLSTRPGGHAGPPEVATPEAQCPGEHVFEYAIAPHKGDWTTIFQAAKAYQTPLIALKSTMENRFVPDAIPYRSSIFSQESQPNISLPHQLSFLTLKPDILGMSAIKKAENEDKAVIRIYNPTIQTQQAKLVFGVPILSADVMNLNEHAIHALPVDGNHQLTVPLQAGEIKTIAVNFPDSFLADQTDLIP